MTRRLRRHLAERYRLILAHTGSLLVVGGLAMLAPAAVALSDARGGVAEGAAFLLPSAALLVIGAGLRLGLRPPPGAPLSHAEGSAIVVLGWSAVCAASAVPFMGILGLDASQSVFEAVSGWTTTGLSVVDVTTAPRSVLLWRSVMQLLGGAGLAILMLAALAGPAGSGMSAAEGRQQLVPHVRTSARLVMTLYTFYAVVGAALYVVAGMDWFDAVNHAFCAVSTGGFSTRAESIGTWDSVAVEAVTLPLMIVGSLNFLAAYRLLRREPGLRSGEVRLSGLLLALSCGSLFLLTTRHLYSGLGRQLRVALFEATTALTTTGYSTVGYGDWAGFGILVLIGLMLVGGGTGSTAGGLKQYRVHVLLRAVGWQLAEQTKPRGQVLDRWIWQAGRKVRITGEQIAGMAAFCALYLTALVLGTAVLAAHGFGLRESLFEFASTLGTVGLSVGVTGPELPGLVLWTQIAGMILGRLEFFVIFGGSAKLARDLRAASAGLVRRP